MTDPIVHEWTEVTCATRTVRCGPLSVPATFYRGHCLCGFAGSWRQTVGAAVKDLKRHAEHGQTSLRV